MLLLNTCLTVRARDANSHSKKGWEEFTDKVVDVIDKYGGANLPNAAGRGRGVVFLAWGAPAAKRVAKLDQVRAHCSCFFLVSFSLSPFLSVVKSCDAIRRPESDREKERQGERVYA